MKKILIVVGARPNFIKISQFKRVAENFPSLQFRIIHTGQHYDDKMSNIFFDQFGIFPDVYLKPEQGTPVTKMANIMLELEKVFREQNPDLVLVVGDVNSTAIAAFTANKMNIKVGHIESGLRSFDRSMPEEFNRIIADDIADYFFVTEQNGMDNLLNEGKPADRIFFVGNTMIDTMIAFKNQINESAILDTLKLNKKKYILLTIHRPATVDSKEGLTKLFSLLDIISKKYNTVFPVHPRTVKNMKLFGLYENFSGNHGLIMTDPLDYFSFQKLIKECFCVITDSGGIQEETTFLNIPCLTLRANSERPVTITTGTNELVPFDEKLIIDIIASIECSTFKKGAVPPLWDGRSTERIINIISEKLTLLSD